MIAAIIPAAGTGSRFGGTMPKQFLQLAGKPILQHVIERFLNETSVSRVIVPVAEMLLASIENVSDRVQFVAGGETRQESVARGLELAGDADLVVVHDAVRPLFSITIFDAVVAAAQEHGAALPVIPVSDTIHVMNGDATIASTLDRSMLGAAQTPQAFQTEILRDILGRATAEALHATDEAGLAARLGYRVKAVPGDPRNIKITVPEDLEVAESYLEQWRRA